MSPQIVIVLAILAAAVVLFVTERLRADLVALLVLLALALTGVLSGEEAIAGFSNEAVITIASVLILSGGLMRTGVAHLKVGLPLTLLLLLVVVFVLPLIWPL